MFGLDSFGVGLAYLLCILSTLLCVVYGVINWNKGQNEVAKDDVEWAKEEEKIDNEL